VSDETEVVIPAVAFSGETFSAARQRLGLSTEEVARQLHLSEAVIRSIEQSAFDQLKDPVFCRGYIRSYARFLKLDADAQVAAYNQQTGNLSTTAQVRPIGTVSTVQGRHHGHPILKVGSWLFLLALVAVSVWWWQAQFGFNAEQRPALDDLPVSVETTDGTTLVLPQLDDAEFQELEAEAPAAGDVDSALDSDAPALPEMPAALLPNEQASVTLATPAADTMAQEPTVVEDAATVESFSGLALSFSEDCWLSVKDASGRTVYSGVAKAESSLELGGEAPLAVVIGRVSAVAEMRYAGQAIDLAALSKDNVARLSLPL